MRFLFLSLMLIATWAAAPVQAQSYRRTITITLENSSPFPNHVQVRDMEAHLGFPEDCRVARKVVRRCDEGSVAPPGPGLTCTAARAVLEEPRCAIKDLIFDDWMDGDTTVELTVHLGRDGYGLVGVRAVNNTGSWTLKPGLRDGDKVEQQ
ncbi:hypothetical protein [Geomesophilobacter sediminis]|uniref:Uncharacterized protein n=1 Tax=Geomesophilobacter sediminis TaxID=2798584 RepID=A0A8J7JG07_9BACT|nr:hypothetical protein [Geomesophilobacter sediminis]MBJ6723270.1 hypothetical protein [Geomesophilobacter sediminis]